MPIFYNRILYKCNDSVNQLCQKGVFFLKIEKKIILDWFSHFQAFREKAEGSYQSSGLDLYCYVLLLNDVRVLI